jgi:hypothetical protein
MKVQARCEHCQTELVNVGSIKTGDRHEAPLGKGMGFGEPGPLHNRERCRHQLKTQKARLAAAIDSALALSRDRQAFVMMGAMGFARVERILQEAIAQVDVPADDSDVADDYEQKLERKHATLVRVADDKRTLAAENRLLRAALSQLDEGGALGCTLAEGPDYLPCGACPACNAKDLIAKLTKEK